MNRITHDTKLTGIERLLVGPGPSIDFEASDDYYVWDGSPQSEWTVDGVEQARYGDVEDRIELTPDGDQFICTVEFDGEQATVNCRAVP